MAETPWPGALGVPAVSVKGLTKSYPGVAALHPTDLDIRHGVIHALVGENGAGKSTFLKIIAGAQPATEGEIRIFGEEVTFAGPRQARRLGVVAVYQELAVLPNLTALENVFIGQFIRRGAVPDMPSMRAEFAALAKRMDVELPLNAKAGSLSIADQQVLEIMRALHAKARLLLLDEPTASLALHEREALGNTMLTLAREGVSVIWISHDLDEVLALSDDISVFREGSYIETRPASEWDKRGLVQAMLGDRDHVVPFIRTQGTNQRRVSVRSLVVPGVLDAIDIDLDRGEILGVAGLMGSGRTELLRALAGLDPTATGSLTIDDEEVPLPRSPRTAVKAGIALAPEDRKGQGLVLSMTTEENISMPAWRKLQRLGVLRPGSGSAYASDVAKRVGLSQGYLRRTIRTLSGGNQQKAVLGKWAEQNLRLFLVDEPTRGIGIAAKGEVYRLLDGITQTGASVLLVSSEFDELVEVCDRVIVLAAHRVVGQIGKRELSEQEILSSIFQVAS